MEFYIWHYWTIAAILLFILEIFTPSFVVFNFGIGAIFATIVSVLGFGIEVQILLFCVGTLISFFAIRPLAIKYAYKKSDNRVTNNEALIGREAIVVTPINNQENKGEVKVDGDIWQARTVDHQKVEKNTVVTIVDFKSITVYVKTVNQE